MLTKITTTLQLQHGIQDLKAPKKHLFAQSNFHHNVCDTNILISNSPYLQWRVLLAKIDLQVLSTQSTY